jgi:hypothetical protein
VGNFLLGYLPYSMWIAFLPCLEKSREWKSGSWRSWINYFLIAFISSAACAVVISIVVDALGIVPYPVLTKIITLNDTFASWIGVILLISVFDVTKQQLGLFWADVMDEGDIGSPIAGTLGAWVVTVASVVGLLGGTIATLSTTTIGWICALAIILGSLLL